MDFFVFCSNFRNYRNDSVKNIEWFYQIITHYRNIFRIHYVLLFFSLALKKIDIGVAYAIWGATGITVIAIIGIIFFHEAVTVLKVVSIFFIVIGVIGVNLSRMG